MRPKPQKDQTERKRFICTEKLVVSPFVVAKNWKPKEVPINWGMAEQLCYKNGIGYYYLEIMKGTVSDESEKPFMN